jgi:hypothetical protein
MNYETLNKPCLGSKRCAGVRKQQTHCILVKLSGISAAYLRQTRQSFRSFCSDILPCGIKIKTGECFDKKIEAGE